MIPMSDLLSFSKDLIDEYEESKTELGPVRQYFYDILKYVRHYAIQKYMRSSNYYDDDLLAICQRLAVNQTFMHFTALLIIAKCKMNQDFSFDSTDYLN